MMHQKMTLQIPGYHCWRQDGSCCTSRASRKHCGSQSFLTAKHIHFFRFYTVLCVFWKYGIYNQVIFCHLTYLDQDVFTIILLDSGHEHFTKLMVFLLHMKHSIHIFALIERYCKFKSQLIELSSVICCVYLARSTSFPETWWRFQRAEERASTMPWTQSSW